MGRRKVQGFPALVRAWRRFPGAASGGAPIGRIPTATQVFPQPLDLKCDFEIARGAAERGGAASWRALLALLGLLVSCAAPPPERDAPATAHVAEWASSTPASCAWFGSRSGDLLWFGVSGYWAESRRAGARAALATPEPARIGRFHLVSEEMLPPLPLPDGPTRGGTWDVLALGDGRVVYTGLAEHAGWVEAGSGTQTSFGIGAGANELAALGDSGRLAVSDYFAGEIAIAGFDGAAPRRLSLSAEGGLRVAPKTVAFDPARSWLWATTDLFSGEGEDLGHDARAVDLGSGEEVLRIADPELQTLAFDERGVGYLAWSTTGGLVLQVLDPSDAPRPGAGRRIPLAPDFDPTHDYAQDLAIDAGHIVVTTWGGRVFVVDPESERVRVAALPRAPPGSLYYSAALVGDRVCATRCGGVAVVCRDLP